MQTNQHMTLVDAARFKAMDQAGEPLEHVAVFKSFTGARAKAIDREKRIVEFILSNGSTDREGDDIDPNGWDLSDYEHNAVVQWAHSHDEPPIAKALRTWIEGGQLKARDQFTTADENPFGDMIFKLIVGGYLNAVSVGFQPTEWEMSETGVKFKHQSLLEHSVVPVPALPSALIAARAKGINTTPLKTWAEKTLDVLHAGAERDRVARLRTATNERTLVSLAGIDVPTRRPKAGATRALQQALAMLNEKAGARHSAADMALLQAAHDSLRALGACCTTENGDKELIVDGSPIIDDDISISEADVKAILESVIREKLMAVTGIVD